jgi:DNA-binding GntR family transcriptional regulator
MAMPASSRSNGRGNGRASVSATPPGRSSEIADALTREILRGDWEVGSPLRQEALADRFHVSRTPVREALARLVALGLATFQPNAGFRVRGVSRDEYLDAMVIRSRLEGLAAERATVRATTAQLRQVAKMGDALEATGRRVMKATGTRRLSAQKQWSRGNEEFHNFLVELAECPPLAMALANTIRANPRDVTWLAMDRFPNVLVEYADDHRAIHDAMVACDPELARALATQHVERAREYLRRTFELDEQQNAPELISSGPS